MNQLLLKISFPLLLLFSINAHCYGQADKLPKKVNQYLTQNYSDWQLAKAPYYDDSGMVQGTSRKKGDNFTSSDYDGNGKEDYALMVEFADSSRKNNKGFTTLVLMSNDKGFQEYELDGGCSVDCVISTLPKTYDIKEVYTDKKVSLKNPAVIIAYLGKAATVFYYTKGEFVETQIAD